MGSELSGYTRMPYPIWNATVDHAEVRRAYARGYRPRYWIVFSENGVGPQIGKVFAQVNKSSRSAWNRVFSDLSQVAAGRCGRMIAGPCLRTDRSTAVCRVPSEGHVPGAAAHIHCVTLHCDPIGTELTHDEPVQLPHNPMRYLGYTLFGIRYTGVGQDLKIQGQFMLSRSHQAGRIVASVKRCGLQIQGFGL
jgi:hypothetical protein